MNKLIILALISVFALSCVRADVVDDFTKCLNEATTLMNACVSDNTCATDWSKYSQCKKDKGLVLGANKSFSEMIDIQTECKKSVTNEQVKKISEKDISCDQIAFSKILGFSLIALLAMLF